MTERLYLVKHSGDECAADCPQLGPGYCRLFNEQVTRSSPTRVRRCPRCMQAVTYARPVDAAPRKV